MTSRPDFSPSMLKFFLFARCLTLDGFAQTEAGRRAARHALADRLMKETGLPHSVIRSAFAGRLIEVSPRAAIWAVLGHIPADHSTDLWNDKSTARAAKEFA